MRIKDSDHITLEDVLIRTTSNWTVHLFMSQHITVKDLKIVNTIGYWWQDGMALSWHKCHYGIALQFCNS